MKLLDQYKELNIVTVGDGKTVSFGVDMFQNGSIRNFSPLHPTNRYHYSHTESHMEDLASLFHLSLSIEAFEQFQELQQIIWNLQVNDN
jgi:hypothetical protein